MIETKNEIPNNNTKQAFWVAFGSFFSVGFGIISSMVLSRYLDKEDYGTYKQVIYVYSTLLTIFTLGLPRAYSYFLPRVNLSHAKDLIKKITNIFLFLGFIFFIILFFGSEIISRLLNNENLIKALKIFAPVPIFLLPTMGLDGILATYKKTKFLAIYNIVSRFFMLFCVIIPVIIWNCSYVGALIGFLISSFLTFLVAWYLKYLPIKNQEYNKCDINYKTILKFSLPLLYASIWGMLINGTPQFFISRYFGTIEFANFSNGFMAIPLVNIIVNSCTIVLSPLFSKMQYAKVSKNEIRKLWINSFKKSALLIYPLVLFCLFFAKDVMIVMYGDLYSQSATYFQIKIIIEFLNIIAFGPLLINWGKTKLYANVHLVEAISLIFFCWFISIFFPNPNLIASAVTIISSFGILYFIYIISKLLNFKILDLFPWTIIIKIIISSIILLLIIKYFVNFFFCYPIVKLFVSMILFFISYFIISIPLKLKYLELFKPIFNHKI